jgi:hypothetical protein
MKNSLFRWEGGSGIAGGDLVNQVHQLTLSLDDKITKIAAQLSKMQLHTDTTFTGEPQPGEQAQMAPLAQGLPSPRLLRRIIRNRSYRCEYFPPGLFADPAWDMLLDLAAAHAEGRKVSITSLCLASGVPTTTALRYVELLIASKMCARSPDPKDRRRIWIELTDCGSQAVEAFFIRIKPAAESDTPSL